MVSVTEVAPLPAAMVAGEKVAVAPVGRPETLNVIALWKVVPVAGVSERAKVAVPPGVVVAELEPVLGGATAKLSAATVKLAEAVVAP
jgi:hypothetical protein